MQPHWSESILQQGQAAFGHPSFAASTHPSHALSLPPPPPPPPPPPHNGHYIASQTQLPIHYSPQPPPPPPRNASHPSSRRTSSFGDGSFLAANLSMGVERSCSSGHEAGMGQARPTAALGGGEEQPTLTKLSQEIGRIEFETQSQIQALVLEVSKLKKDREISWKHVVELKEQNQMLRDRLREQQQRELPLRDLEAQNQALMAQNQSMATALNAIQERLGPLMALASHLQQGGQLPMAPHQQPKAHVPHVPHSGADIW